MSSALNIVQKFFPGVTRVVDSDRPARIEVSEQDANPKAKKNHEECALAVACRNKFNLDGVVIARTTAYLVKGKKARRFILPPSTTREVVSFDRGGGFAPGTYQLSAVTKRHKLGLRRGSKAKNTGLGGRKQFRHLTTGIRATLGGGEKPQE